MNFSLNVPSVSQLSAKKFEDFGSGGGFNDYRTLQQYYHTAENSLKESVENLQQDQLWVDIGCGEAKAVKQYVRSFPNGGHAIGVTVLRPHCFEKFLKNDNRDNRLGLYLGDFLSLPMEPINSKVTLITDIYGVFQYSGQLSLTLKKVYNLLHCGGKAFITFTFSPQYFTTVKIINEDGIIQEKNPEVVMLWLKSVKGFTFSEELTEEYSNRKIVLERTSEPFHADPFYIQENLESDEGTEKRTICEKIFDVFCLKDLFQSKKKAHWKPSVKDFKYYYNFNWEVSESNKALLEQAID